MNKSTLATLLHCSPTMIHVDYESKANQLASDFIRLYSYDIKDNSLNNDYLRIDRTIVMNRIHQRINFELHTNPLFSPQTFSDYIKPGNLFYSLEDVQLLAGVYSSCPDEAFKYCMAFFAIYIHKFKKEYSFIVKKMDSQDVNQILLTAIHRQLLGYNASEKHFSFNYLHQELQAALFQYAGSMLTIPINRNDFSLLTKLVYYINKYGVNTYNLAQFLLEINSSYEVLSAENRIFELDLKDHSSGFNITYQKAAKLLSIYTTTQQDTRLSLYTDDEAPTESYGGKLDDNYNHVELTLLRDTLFPEENLRQAFDHLITSPNSTFTKYDLEKYKITRYQLNKMIDLLRHHLM